MVNVFSEKSLRPNEVSAYGGVLKIMNGWYPVGIWFTLVAQSTDSQS